MNGTDAIKYLAAKLAADTDWAVDAIGGSGCGYNDSHDVEVGALDNAEERAA